MGKYDHLIAASDAVLKKIHGENTPEQLAAMKKEAEEKALAEAAANKSAQVSVPGKYDHLIAASDAVLKKIHGENTPEQLAAMKKEAEEKALAERAADKPSQVTQSTLFQSVQPVPATPPAVHQDPEVASRCVVA